jgi:hypothetical protein
MGRFTFPATTQANFLINLMDSENRDFGDSAQVVSNTEISGDPNPTSPPGREPAVQRSPPGTPMLFDFRNLALYDKLNT